ncbi:MAG: BlaI/MecI/CopY family transcriptional regulator [bacterium]|nr:BlaI/MecI/CopY family transcriptional regulator [bacterium]
MARPRSPYPTELELEILKVLWRQGPASVREVREALAGSRALAHTSVMTIMTIMTQKGYLKRAKQAGRFVYRPSISEKSTAGRMLRDIVRRAFDGSAAAVMLNLLETADLDEQELKTIRTLINRKAKEQER